jgi:hypothetical protein
MNSAFRRTPHPGSTAALASRHELSLVNLHCHRPHDQFEREYKARLIFSSQNRSLQPLQGSTPDSHAPARCQVWMRFDLMATVQAVPYGLDIFLRQRSGMTIEADQVNDAGNLQKLQPIAQRQLYEHITWKQRHLKLHTAIFPSPHRLVEWQIVLDRSLLQLLCDTLFVVCVGVSDIPERLKEARRHPRIVSRIHSTVGVFRAALQSHD